jgi:hypothetical protein
MGRPPAAAQCEPVDLEPIDVEAPAPLSAPRPISRRVWITVAVVALVAWGAIAFATRDLTHDTPPRTPIDVLSAGIIDIGTGRFAAVVDNKLSVIEPDRPGLHTTVPLATGPIAVTGQSGDSLAVQTSDGNAIAFTAPIHSELVPLDRPVIADVVPDRWWTQHKDNILSRFDNPPVLFPWPAGRAVAATPKGFVVESYDESLWLVSDTDRRQLQYGTFLAANDGLIAVRSPCSMGSCDVIVRDLRTGRAWVLPMFETIVGAAIERTGEHIALETATGETLLVDITDHRTIARLPSQVVQPPAAPFAWLPNGETLLVAQPGRVAVVRALDGEVERTIPVPGVQQIFALP